MMVYGLLAPQTTTNDQTDHMGMFGPHSTYSSRSVLLIAVGVVAIVSGLMVIFLRQEYEPLPESMAAPPIAKAEPAPSPEHARDDEAAKEFLALRLLTGDERTMFKAIMDSGGEALQKDLILRTHMSNSKVSRVLDRLSAKGVITKERHGSTNRIRIRMNS